MKGYWVGTMTDGDVETLRLRRLSAARVDSLIAGLWERHWVSGTKFTVDVWRSKDNQTSGEAPVWSINSNEE